MYSLFGLIFLYFWLPTSTNIVHHISKDRNNSINIYGIKYFEKSCIALKSCIWLTRTMQRMMWFWIFLCIIINEESSRKGEWREKNRWGLRDEGVAGGRLRGEALREEIRVLDWSTLERVCGMILSITWNLLEMDMGMNISDIRGWSVGISSDEKGIVFVPWDISDLCKIWQNWGETLRITESLEFTCIILYVNMGLSMYGDYLHSESWFKDSQNIIGVKWYCLINIWFFCWFLKMQNYSNLALGWDTSLTCAIWASQNSCKMGLLLVPVSQQGDSLWSSILLSCKVEPFISHKVQIYTFTVHINCGCMLPSALWRSQWILKI